MLRNLEALLDNKGKEGKLVVKLDENLQVENRKKHIFYIFEQVVIDVQVDEEIFLPEKATVRNEKTEDNEQDKN